MAGRGGVKSGQRSLSENDSGERSVPPAALTVEGVAVADPDGADAFNRYEVRVEARDGVQPAANPAPGRSCACRYRTAVIGNRPVSDVASASVAER